MQSQSYENVKFAIGVPTAGLIHGETVFGMCTIVGTMSQIQVYPETTVQSMSILIQPGSTIPRNRQKIVNAALEQECTHLLFIDDDMAVTADAFLTMARRRQPIVVCNYRMRGEPYSFTAMRPDHSGRVITRKDSTGIEPCKYAGLGMALIETRVFKALKPPYFLNRLIDDEISTEDVPFFLDAKEAGFQAYVDHDASKQVAHIGEMTFRWNLDHTDKVIGDATAQ